MAIRLEDCPPALHAAIMKQLAKEGANKPVTTIKWAVASRANNKWSIGPATTNRVLVAKLVKQLQCTRPVDAHETSIGNPPAVIVEFTTTTNPTEPTVSTNHE
jgi:hypothetical protein